VEVVTGSGLKMLQPIPPSVLQVILAVGTLCVAVFIGIAVAGRLRRATNIDDTSDEDLGRNFEEIHRRGGMSDAEFRTIQSVLGKKLTDDPEQSGPTTT
jgi:hypothetical protein